MSLLRDLFGTSETELWAQLAQRLEGELTPGSFWRHPELRVQVDPWVLTLDVVGGKYPFTRLRAAYLNPEGFRFHVYKGGFFSQIPTLFGAQDVQVGDPAFDQAFIVKASDEEKIRKLLTRQLRDLLLKSPELSLQAKDDDEGWFGTSFPKGVDELYLALPGVQTDLPLLKAGFDLFAATLQRLCEIGAARPGEPGVSL
jgi:hypothetical protein